MKKVYTKHTKLGVFKTDTPLPINWFKWLCWILGAIALPCAAFFIFLGIKSDASLVITGAFWSCCAIFLIAFPIMQKRAWQKFYEEMRLKDEAEADEDITAQT